MPLPKPWHAFIGGKQTDNRGRVWEIGRDALESIARSFVGRPVQIGHQSGITKTEVAEATVIGDHLVVLPKDIPADLAEQAAGFGLSVQLLQPDHPKNPTPGQWAADHLAFVASPRVKDLLAPAFGDDDQVVLVHEPVAFGSDSQMLVKFMRRLREFVLAQAGAEEAERVFPQAELEILEGDALYERAEKIAENMVMAAYGDDTPPAPDPKDLEIAQLKSQLRQREQQQWLEQAAFGSEGFRLPPTQRERVLALLDRLADVPEPVAFGDQSEAPQQSFKKIIESLPLAVQFGGEISAPKEGDPASFGGDPMIEAQKVAMAAQELVSQGKCRDIVQAVKQVRGIV